MSEPIEVSQQEKTYLPCNTIVYRVIRKRWINEDTQNVKSDAFLLREIDVSTGLSVAPANTCTPEEALSRWENCELATLHVGRLQDIGLKVAIDPNNDKHALIEGLPYKGSNTKGAERFASLLAKQARLKYL
jgi:hypothetical protein